MNSCLLQRHSCQLLTVQSRKLTLRFDVGLFLQSVSYFLATFVVGFILNARLTGILIGKLLPIQSACYLSP